MMASGMWDRLSNTAGALRNQVGRLAEEALASAEEFSQQVRSALAPPAAVLLTDRCLGLRSFMRVRLTRVRH